MAVERRRQPALKVDIPKDESPRFARVGLIALVGFAVGALWPSLARFKLVPNVPGQAAPAPGLGGEPVAASAVPVGSAAAEAPEPPPPAERPRGPSIGELQVTSCKDRKQKRVEPCDSIAFDRVARARLAGLAECEGAGRMNGVLSLGFELDFTSGSIERIASGKSTTLKQAESDSLADCAKKQFAGVEIGGIEHQHDKYTLFYRIEFQAGGAADDEAPAAADAVAVTPASGKATVSWDVALVRSAPSRDGKVVARILSGTRVAVTGRNGDWYEIKYDAKGSQGWVFRTAIGM